MKFAWLIAPLVLFSTAAFAQSSIPAIRFDSIAEPLKLPDGSLLR